MKMTEHIEEYLRYEQEILDRVKQMHEELIAQARGAAKQGGAADGQKKDDSVAAEKD